MIRGLNHMLRRATERSIRDSVGNAIQLAHEHGFQSIAFPFIGAGSGGFNQEQAKALMLDELSKLDVPMLVKKNCGFQESESMTTPIESLRNLGPKSSQWLRDAGITTIAELERLGPVAAFRLVKNRQPKVSLNLLWALTAGLKRTDWRKLPESTKQRLRKEAEEV